MRSHLNEAANMLWGSRSGDKRHKKRMSFQGTDLQHTSFCVIIALIRATLLYLELEIVVIEIPGSWRARRRRFRSVMGFFRVEWVHDYLFSTFDLCTAERATLTFGILKCNLIFNHLIPSLFVLFNSCLLYGVPDILFFL